MREVPKPYRRKRKAARPVHDRLHDPITLDPGDGLGGYSATEFMHLGLIEEALKGSVVALLDCIKLIHRRETERMKNRPLRKDYFRSQRNFNPAGCAPVLVLLGLAEPYTPSNPDLRDGEDDAQRYWLYNWVIDLACARDTCHQDARAAVREWCAADCPQTHRMRDVRPESKWLRRTHLWDAEK